MEEVSNRLSFIRYLHILPGYSDNHKSSQALWRLEALGGERSEWGNLTTRFQDLAAHKGNCEMYPFKMRTGC